MATNDYRLTKKEVKVIEGITVIIPGKPVPVKNSKMPIVKKDGTAMIIDNPKAREWKKWLVDYLTEKYGNIRFNGKVSLGFNFYIHGNGRIDCSNMLQGFEDALQKAGIIEDDTWQLCSIAWAEGSPAKSKKEERTEIYIVGDEYGA